ncbi:hypothetical protein J6590_060377 [Homalodisca vitripennis]|nr:hypothetical protein J6590_060377 [Homalodisca vitripennis]
MYGKISAFADDVSLRYTNKQWAPIWTQITEDRKSLRDWCNNNKMVNNISKTKIVNFDLRGFSFDTDLHFHVVNDSGIDSSFRPAKLFHQTRVPGGRQGASDLTLEDRLQEHFIRQGSQRNDKVPLI